MYSKLNPEIAQKELRRVSCGKEPHVPITFLADYVLRFCTRDIVPTPPVPVRNDETRWLEALYALKDTRHV